MKAISLILIGIIGIANAKSEIFIFNGIVPENAKVVQLEPKLSKIYDDNVCGYKIYITEGDVPFYIPQLSVADAVLEVMEGKMLDYEYKESYKFDIATYTCDRDPKYSKRYPVLVKILDSNEFGPKFARDVFNIEVAEGEEGMELWKFTAIDDDGSSKFHDICSYSLKPPSTPFTVDSEGILRNAGPLAYNKQQFYTFEISATDCGGKTGERAAVNVNVKPSTAKKSGNDCYFSWNDSSDLAHKYRQMDTNLRVFGGRRIIGDCSCAKSELLFSLGEHEGKRQCSLEKPNINRKAEFCGVSKNAEHLFQHLNTTPTIFHSDKAIRIFDLKDGMALKRQFSIYMWLRHAAEHNQKAVNHSGREQLICSTDNKNNVLFSAAIEKCELKVTWRNVYDIEVSGPSTWSWQLTEVCDDTWHHVAISGNYPNIILMVDGVFITSSPKTEFSIVQSTAKVSEKASFTVGSCWKPSTGESYDNYFGQMSGLYLNNDGNERNETLECLSNCAESLMFEQIKDLDEGMTLSYNADRSLIRVIGGDVKQMNKVIEDVFYTNTYIIPKPGTRMITLNAHLTCGGKFHKMDEITARVSVLAIPHATIDIAADEKVPWESDLAQNIFRNLVISPTGQIIDECILSYVTARQPEDSLAYPETFAANNHITISNFSNGLTLQGSASVDAYMQLLNQIKFFLLSSPPSSSKPNKINNEKLFMLACESKGVKSSPVKISLVRRDQEKQDLYGYVQSDRHRISAKKGPPPDEISGSDLSKKDIVFETAHHIQHAQSPIKVHYASPAVLALVVISIALFIGVLIFGVWRLQRSGKQSGRYVSAPYGDAIVESDVNIVVNPLLLQQENTLTDENMKMATCVNFDVSEAEMDSDEADDDDEEEYLYKRQLEWDDGM